MTEAAAQTASPADDSGTCPAGCGQPVLPVFDLRGHQVVQCPICGLYILEIVPSGVGEDRSHWHGALDRIREANYQHILRRLGERVQLRGRKLLDVGCSSGLFLGLASAAGCEGYGIEPEAFFYQRLASARPPRVQTVHGLFPNDLPSDWGAFDVITFHDVFEHLPEPLGALRAARERLTAGGFLVLSLPMADGFVFRIGRLLYRCGWSGPLERMFQVHYPYPHLFYFAHHSLAVLAQRAGFEIVLSEPLPTFSARGSLHRARIDRAVGSAGRAMQYLNAAALVGFALMQRILPADNAWAILRPRSV